MLIAILHVCWWTVDPQTGDAQTLIEEVAGEASSGYAPIVNSYGMIGDRSISDGKQVCTRINVWDKDVIIRFRH